MVHLHELVKRLNQFGMNQSVGQDFTINILDEFSGVELTSSRVLFEKVLVSGWRNVS